MKEGREIALNFTANSQCQRPLCGTVLLHGVAKSQARLSD